MLKKAFYDTMNLTPMAYGFGAHEIKSDIQEGLEVIDYEKVKQRVLEIGKKKVKTFLLQILFNYLFKSIEINIRNFV